MCCARDAGSTTSTLAVSVMAVRSTFVTDAVHSPAEVAMADAFATTRIMSDNAMCVSKPFATIVPCTLAANARRRFA